MQPIGVLYRTIGETSDDLVSDTPTLYPPRDDATTRGPEIYGDNCAHRRNAAATPESTGM
jgi:hypothetical protein